jgi:hypothetical protein
MIPYLKQNYETIIRAINDCVLKKKTIKDILGNDDVKFFSSITEFLNGYNLLRYKTKQDKEFIKILEKLKKLENSTLSGGAIQNSNAKPKITKKIFKSVNPNSKLTKGKLVFTK